MLRTPPFLVVLLGALSAAPVASQTWRTVAKARQYGGEKALKVRVKYAAGHFELGKAPQDLLYQLESKYDDRSFDLDASYLQEQGEGELRVSIEGQNGINLKQLTRDDFGAGSLQLAVSSRMPVQLSMDLGAAEADLELGGLRIRRIELQTGASDTRVTFAEPNPEVAESCSFRAGAASLRAEDLGNSGCKTLAFDGGVGSMELDFSGKWKDDVTATVNVGLGSVNIHVPYDVGVRVERNTFLMSFSAPGLKTQDGAAVSDNWDQAAHHLTLILRGAFGTIDLSRS